MAATLPAGLPRVVPSSGAVISGVEIPGGVRFMPICLRFLPDAVGRQS